MHTDTVGDVENWRALQYYENVLTEGKRVQDIRARVEGILVQ